VASVAFEPQEGIGPYRFREFVALQPGDPWSPELVERSARLLRETGLFESVAATSGPAPGGERVTFTVRPFPLVGDVRVRGNLLLLESTLLPILRLRPAEPFREELLQGDVERLERHYADEGFEGTEVAGEVRRRTGVVEVTYRIREGRPAVVREVQIRGADSLGRKEISAALGVSGFTFFREAELSRGVERLRDLYQERGYLDARVNASVERGEGVIPPLTILFNPIKGLLALRPGGYRIVTVRVDVEEGRRFAASFVGATAVGESELRGLLTFRRSGFFDAEEVEAGRRRILARYQELGYYLAEVEAEADFERGRVTYTIREGRPVPVAAVRFRGVAAVPEARLRAILTTRAGTEGEPSLLRAPDLERDRRRIEALYRELGFGEAEVASPEVWPEQSPAGAEVIFTVREGRRTLVRAVSFEGAAGIAPARLAEAAGLAPGTPYREAEVAAAAARVREAYRHAGYLDATVKPRTDFGPDHEHADVRFVIAEGRQRRLGAVIVTGNGKTRRNVVLRELPLRPGDPFDPARLDEGRLDLYRLGLFREVRYLLPEPAGDGRVQDLVVQVRERPGGAIGFGLGYATDEQYRGFVELSQQNLLGTGRGAGVKASVSTIGYRDDLFYTEPWLLGFDVKGQANLYQERRDEIGYDVLRRGASVGFDRELARRVLLSMRYRSEFVRYENVQPGIEELEGPLESFNIGSLGATAHLDLRDSPISPRRGSFYLGSVEFARPYLGGNASFTKYELAGSWYRPLGRSAEVALGLRGGFTQLLITGGGLPLSERFFLGGDRSVRGYAYKGIGPKDPSGDPLGGNAYALGSLELRFTVWEKVRGVAFVDAGELWAGAEDLPASGLKVAVGPGLRYDTLVGPIRLDLGYKLRPEQGESRTRWHLTIGYPF